MTQQSGWRPPNDTVLGGKAQHGLVVRITSPDQVAVARRAVEKAAGFAAEDPGTYDSFWVTPFEAPSSDARSIRARARELHRPLGPDARVRVVLQTYGDDVADLVAVARRNVLGHAGLRALTHALSEGTLLVADDPPNKDIRGWTPAPPPLWGLADDDPPQPDGDEPTQDGRFAPETVLAAAAVVLSRFEGASAVRLAIVLPSGARVIRVTVDHDVTVGALLGQCLAAADSQESTDHDGVVPPLCLVLDESGPDEEYAAMPPRSVPLALIWHRHQGGFAFAGREHKPDAVHPAVARDLARHVTHMTARLSDARPDLPVADLPLLSDADAAAVVALGHTPAPGRTEWHEPTVHAVIARIARLQPDAVAVVDATLHLTYRELDARSTAWARVLAGHGAAPGRFIGVCLKRAADLVVALLAVLKTGAAYVPLDPQAPDERLRRMAEDAGLALVITTLSGFPASEGTPVLRPTALSTAAEQDADVHLPEVGPLDHAYVIYTSGTTGRPKGVVVPHGNVLALLEATAEDMALGPQDTWTFFHSAAFDFSVWEIWGCLLTGGRLVIVPYLVSRSPEDFHALVRRERVTVLSQTPSAFVGFLEADARGPATTPRLVVFGGEAFDPRVLGDWFRRHPDSECRLVNMYGITETTVHATAYDVRSWNARCHPQRVGRALPGWSVSVRDPRGRPLPPGALGEIWVGGAGVAAGYLNRPSLTAERFVTDRDGGSRWYRSGDIGRLRLDGSIDHAGRLDDQVKLRGFRIELGEVRSVLLNDPAVTDAAVVVDGPADDSARRRLLGYVVLAEGDGAGDVKRRVSMVLPDYMVPSELIALPALPLTANGKLDRAALPRGGRTSGPARTVAPSRGGRAEAMLTVWRSVMAPDLGPEDHFFERGGNSLLAVRLLTALRKAGFPGVSMRDLYAHPTPTLLAAATSAPGFTGG
jgi:amino acid adenylation domain-containing protein